MKKTLLLFLGLFAAGWCYGQSLSPEVIAGAGDHFTNADAQLSWTLGEPVIETYASGAAQLTQGFHQTSLTVVAVDDPVTGFAVRVYPNPTADWVSIESQLSSPPFSLELSDAQGRTLPLQAATQQGMLRSLDLSGYATGVYYLRLRTEDPKTTQTFKIIKHN